MIESDPENPLYVLDGGNYICPAKVLEENGYKVVQTEPAKEIKEMTVEEVSKLVGKKVKIVE